MWSNALVTQMRAGFCSMWAQELSYLMNLGQGVLKKITFHFPVFLSDVWTHSLENADLSVQPFSLWRSTSSIWFAEFLEGPPKHSWAVTQTHKPFPLQLVRNHTALYRYIRRIYISLWPFLIQIDFATSVCTEWNNFILVNWWSKQTKDLELLEYWLSWNHIRNFRLMLIPLYFSIREEKMILLLLQ